MATAESCEGQYPLPLDASLSRTEQDILLPSVPARLLAEDEWGEVMRNRYSAGDLAAPEPPKLRCRRSSPVSSAGNKSTNFWERMLQKRRQIRRVNQARKARGWRRSLAGSIKDKLRFGRAWRGMWQSAVNEGSGSVSGSWSLCTVAGTHAEHPSRDDLVAAAHEPSHSSPGQATTHDEEESVVYLPPPNSSTSSSLHSPSSSSFSHLASSNESSTEGQFSFFPLGISSLAAHSSTNTLGWASSQSFQSFTSEQVRELDIIEGESADSQDEFDHLSTYLDLPPEDQHDIAPQRTEAESASSVYSLSSHSTHPPSEQTEEKEPVLFRFPNPLATSPFTMDQTEEIESVQPHSPRTEGQGIISSPSKEHEATPHLSFSLRASSRRGAELSRIPRVPGLTQMLRTPGETSRDSSPDTTAPLSPVPRRSAIPIRVRRDTATAQEFSFTESPDVQTGGIRILSGSSSHSSTSSQPHEDGDNHNNLATISEKSLDVLAGSTGSISDEGDSRPAPIRMGPTVRISSSADRYILGHETGRTHARPEAYRSGNVYYPRVIQADSPPNETEDGGGLSTGQESGYDADDEPHSSTADSLHNVPRAFIGVETHPHHDISPGHSYSGARIGMGQAARHTPQHIIERRSVLGSAIVGPSRRAFLGFSSHPPDTQGSPPSDMSPELPSSRRLVVENPSRLPGMEPRSHGAQSSSSNDPFSAPPIRLPVRRTFAEAQGHVYPWHEDPHSQSPESPIASHRPLAKFSSYPSDTEGQSRGGQTSESEDLFHAPPTYRQSAVTSSRSSPQVETPSQGDKSFRPKELSYGLPIRRKQVPRVSQSPASKIPRRGGSPPSDRCPTSSQQLPQMSSGTTLTNFPVVDPAVSPTIPGDLSSTSASAGQVGATQHHSRTTSHNPLLDFIDTESGGRPIALGTSASIPTLRSNLTFDDIVTRHPEVEGRVIQTNVARVTERRTARLVGNLRHVFSRNRAERRDPTFEIVNTRTTSRSGGSSNRKEPRNKLAQTIRASASTAALPRLGVGLQRRAPSLPQLSTTARAYSTGSPGERDSRPRIRAVRSGSFIPRIGHPHYKGPAARTGATRTLSEGGDLEPRRVQACLLALEEGLVQETDLDGRRSLLSAWTDLRSLYSDYVSRDARVSESAQLLSQLRVEVKLVKCALLVELERAYAQLDSRNDAGVADGVAGDE